MFWIKFLRVSEKKTSAESDELIKFAIVLAHVSNKTANSLRGEKNTQTCVKWDKNNETSLHQHDASIRRFKVHNNSQPVRVCLFILTHRTMFSYALIANPNLRFDVAIGTNYIIDW